MFVIKSQEMFITGRVPEQRFTVYTPIVNVVETVIFYSRKMFHNYHLLQRNFKKHTRFQVNKHQRVLHTQLGLGNTHPFE